MSRRRPLLAAAIGSLAVLGFAVTACADDPDPEPVVFTEPGSIFEVGVDEEITIVLESNATTGYAWELETPPLADVVRLVEDVYIEPEPTSSEPPVARSSPSRRSAGERPSCRSGTSAASTTRRNRPTAPCSRWSSTSEPGRRPADARSTRRRRSWSTMAS